MVKYLHKLTVLQTSFLDEAISKLKKSSCKTICVIDKNGHLLGVISDSDIRNSILAKKSISKNTKCIDIMNKNYVSAKNKIDAMHLIDDRTRIVPIINENGKLLDVYTSSPKSFFIGNRQVGNTSKTFIIAEIGVNHNGDMEQAKLLIDHSIAIGADAVKFQMRDIEELYGNFYLKNRQLLDLGAQYQLDHLEKLNFSFDQHKKLRDYCFRKNIFYICTPFDLKSARSLLNFELDAVKIASSDFSNSLLLREVSNYEVPVIFSTGMSTQQEIRDIVPTIKEYVLDFALLHCNSTYPSPYFDINLNYLKNLRNFHPIVGYSGHERGIEVSIAARALGADIIERHITIDQNANGPDHSSSLNVKEFGNLIESIRIVEESLGKDGNRQPTQGENLNRQVLAKSIVTNRNLKKGHKLIRSDLDFKCPGNGISPYNINQVLGKKINKDLEFGEIIYPSSIIEDGIEHKNKEYKIPYNWGIPVRLHDVENMNQLFNPKILEFHPSYNDLKLLPSKYISVNKKTCVVFHCPEMINKNELLNLASIDENKRKKHIDWFKLFLEHCLSILDLIQTKDKSKIVINVGGFSNLNTMNKNELNLSIEALIDSFKEIKNQKFELIPQTMPPFPWHFGGQHFHNLFVHPNQVLSLAKKLDVLICLDTSHTILACNQLGLDFNKQLEKLLPITSHIHLGDADSEAREGLQIGEGNLNLKLFFNQLLNLKWNGTLIPEIWQGHIDNGSGFDLALRKIEGIHG